MTETLPALPLRPGEVTAQNIYELEQVMPSLLADVDDLRTLAEWQAQADALAAYLVKHDLDRPALGIQRRIEARIGQLFSPAHRGVHSTQKRAEAALFPAPATRSHFRYLARALNGEVQISEEEWQQSRDALVHLIRARLGNPPRRQPVERVRARRRQWGRTRLKRDRPQWLRNTVSHSHEAAELAGELADAATVRDLTDEQASETVAAISQARRDLARVRRQLRRYRNV